MIEEVLIFGHDLCPYTSRAREDFARRKIPFNYVNVLKDNDGLQRMLKHSNRRARRSLWKPARSRSALAAVERFEKADGVGLHQRSAFRLLRLTP